MTKYSVTSAVKPGDGLPVFTVNGEDVLPCGYMSYHTEQADYDGFRNAGYRLFFVPVYAGDRGINPMSGIRPFYRGFWTGEDQYDFSDAARCLRRAIGDAKPGDVWIIPRVMLEPPTFWEQAHPDELCRDAAGASVHQSYSSDVWLADTKKAMEAFAAWLCESGIDEYVAGWQLACGWTEEFMRPMTHPLQLTDYSRPAVRAWQGFLREKYGSIDALNGCWQSEYPSFDAIGVPTPAQRTYLPDGETKWPPFVIDHNRFRSVETARALTKLAHFAKEITGGRRVIGAFYGYAGTRFGHDAVDIVLDSPDVDFLAGPFSYDTGRAIGTDWALPAVLGSCRRHDKAWFVECDVRTHLSRPLVESMPWAAPAGNTQYEGPIWFGPDDEDVCVHQMKKAIAKVVAGGAAMWWFDMWGGWFDTPKYMDCVQKSLNLYRRQTGGWSVAQVAVVSDPYARGRRTGNADMATFWQNIARSGAALEHFALTDLDKLDPGNYRAIVLVNVSDRLPEIKTWCGAGRSVVSVCSDAIPSNGEEPVSAVGKGTVTVYGDWQRYSFDQAPDTAALREAFLIAGTHIYTFTDDIVYAFGSMIAIHATSDGEKRLTMPEICSLADAFTGERPVSCEHFTDFPMKKGETRVFEICP